MSRYFRPVAALTMLALIWGYNWVVMKRSLQFMGPFDFNALRMALGGVILLVSMSLTGISLRPRDIPRTVLLGLFQTAAGTGLIIWALVAGGAGKTAILVYTMPFWIILFARPILAERIRGRHWVPVAMAFGGMVLLLEPWRSKGTAFSELLAVAAGVCWAVSAVLIKVMQKRPGFDLVSVTAWQFVYGSVPLVFVALVVPQRPVAWTPYLVAAVAYNAVLVCAVSFLLWTYIMKRLPAGVAGMGTLAVPVIGVSTSMLELGERPDTCEAVGMVLILLALFLLSFLRLREHRGAQEVPETFEPP